MPAGLCGLYGDYARRAGVCEVLTGKLGAFVVLCPASGCELVELEMVDGDLGR